MTRFVCPHPLGHVSTEHGRLCRAILAARPSLRSHRDSAALLPLAVSAYEAETRGDAAAMSELAAKIEAETAKVSR